jgi:hypothetical protein
MDPRDVLLGLAGFFLVLWLACIVGYLYQRGQRNKDRPGKQER